jgi:hypothetical protein
MYQTKLCHQCGKCGLFLHPIYIDGAAGKHLNYVHTTCIDSSAVMLLLCTHMYCARQVIYYHGAAVKHLRFVHVICVNGAANSHEIESAAVSIKTLSLDYSNLPVQCSSGHISSMLIIFQLLSLPAARSMVGAHLSVKLFDYIFESADMHIASPGPIDDQVALHHHHAEMLKLGGDAINPFGVSAAVHESGGDDIGRRVSS